MKTYRLVGSHAEDLASGQQVAPGEFVKLDKYAEGTNQRLIDGGLLVEVKPARKTTSTEEG